jgi:hypothetical protein
MIVTSSGSFVVVVLMVRVPWSQVSPTATATPATARTLRGRPHRAATKAQ